MFRLYDFKIIKLFILLFNQTLFIIVSVVVLSLLILSTLEYIELGLLIIPIVLPYLIWLFILMRLSKNK